MQEGEGAHAKRPPGARVHPHHQRRQERRDTRRKVSLVRVAHEDKGARPHAQVDLRVLQLPLKRVDGADAEEEAPPGSRSARPRRSRVTTGRVGHHAVGCERGSDELRVGRRAQEHADVVTVDDLEPVYEACRKVVIAKLLPADLAALYAAAVEQRKEGGSADKSRGGE